MGKTNSQIIDEIKSLGNFVVIVDDEVDDGISSCDSAQSKTQSSVINSIRLFFLTEKIPIVCYKTLPSTIDIFDGSSISIIDWEMNPLKGETTSSNVQEEVSKNVISIIEGHIKKYFSPVLIITFQDESTIEWTLEQEKWYANNKTRIIIKQKSSFNKDGSFSKELFLSFLDATFEKMPSLPILNDWRKTMLDSGNQLFIEMFSFSPNWARTLFNSFADGEQNKTLALKIKREHFGSFLSNNLLSRTENFSFKSLESLPNDDTSLHSHKEKSFNPLLEKIIENSKTIKYQESDDTSPLRPYSGDIFLFESKPENLEQYLGHEFSQLIPPFCLINIRAQCDLARAKDGLYKNLYCLVGRFSNKLIKKKDCFKSLILTKDSITDSFGKIHSFQEISGMKPDQIRCLQDDINGEGSIVIDSDYFEEPHEAKVSCILEHNTVSFDFKNLYSIPFDVVKSNRVERLLDPFLARVQQKFAYFMVRTGVPNTPLNAFMTNPIETKK